MNEKNLTKENINKEIIQQIRKDTGIAISLCVESVKESNNNYEKALFLAKEKCKEVGKKFYKNINKKCNHFFCFLFETKEYINIIKIGSETELIINSNCINTFLENLNKNSLSDMEIEDNLLYICGLLKENIQIYKIQNIKKNLNSFYLFYHKNPTPNEKVFGGIGILNSEKEIIDDIKKEILIQTSILYGKKILNNSLKENVNSIFFYEFSSEDIENFLNSPLLSDKSILIKDLLKDNKIYSIFYI